MGSLFRHSVEFSTSFSNSYFPISKYKEQKCTANSSSIKSQDGISLVLGLGQSSHSCISTFPMKLNEQNSLNLDQDLKYSTSNEGIVRHNNLFGYTTKPKLDLELSLSTSYAESDLSPSSQEISSFRNFTCSPLCATPFSNAYSRVNTHHINPILSQATVNALSSSVPGTSGITHQQPKRKSGVKSCQFEGCRKGARGAKGLCISHGGGARCQRNGCLRGAEGKTGFCKAHGGGRRCQRLGCTKSAEGRTDYCIRHGGGRRCSQEGCDRASRGKSGLCIRHGGGKRCTVEGCSKSAEGVSRKCISHGGAAVASILAARRVPREAPCSVRPTVAVNDAHFWGVCEVLKVAPSFVKAMVGGRDVRTRVGVIRASTVGLHSVFATVVGKDAM